MARRKYEKTQKGNRHGLPIKQHIFPSASIIRFANDQGFVNLHQLSIDQIRKAKPSDDIFWVRRAWDARAETGYMKQIEDDFQFLASSIIGGKTTKIEASGKHAIDQFFGLWKWRGIYRTKEMTPIQLKGLAGDQFTQDQEEILEKKGIIYTRAGGIVPAHQMHGIQIQGGIMHEMSALKNIRWVITHLHSGQFIVPDVIATTFIPLSPTICLFGTTGNAIDGGTILKANAVSINQHIKSQCKEYYFANDIKECF